MTSAVNQLAAIASGTVGTARPDATPPARKALARVAPVLGAYEATVRGWLVADKEAPREQRHTARRVWQRLVDEEGAVVAESSVHRLVARLRVEMETGGAQVVVPQTYPEAREAEVDFREFKAVIAGVLMRLWMFVMRLSCSGKAVHVVYANQAQESFLDGHARAFAVFGGVPTGMIRYDNLKPAVIRVLLGRDRWENPRFVALRSHYGFDSFTTRPGSGTCHARCFVQRARRAISVVDAALAAELASERFRRTARCFSTRWSVTGPAQSATTKRSNAGVSSNLCLPPGTKDWYRSRSILRGRVQWPVLGRWNEGDIASLDIPM